MFVDLYFPRELQLDRDEIQERLEAVLEGRGEVVGAGTGPAGTNLDLEIADATDGAAALAAIIETLASIGVPSDTVVAVSDPPSRRTLAELTAR